MWFNSYTVNWGIPTPINSCDVELKNADTNTVINNYSIDLTTNEIDSGTLLIPGNRYLVAIDCQDTVSGQVISTLTAEFRTYPKSPQITHFQLDSTTRRFQFVQDVTGTEFY